jgi:GNAT superfamily N-acetyltransferase
VQVVQLISSIQRGEFSVGITIDEQPDLAQIDEFYQRGRGGFWVATAGAEEVVGTIGLVDIGGPWLALRKMFVDARYRGAAGAGALLLRAALDHAASGAVEEIYLGTIDRMKAAARFYEKHGFVPVEKSELPASFPIMAVDNRFYRYTLRRAH